MTYRQWSDEIKQLAYEYWALKCSQNAEATAKELASEIDGESPSSSVIRYWARQYGWALKIRDSLFEVAPATRDQTITDLILGSREAAAVLRRIVNDQDVDDRDRVKASLILLDRAGYSPVGRNDKTQTAIESDGRGINRWLTEEALGTFLGELGIKPIGSGQVIDVTDKE